MAVGTDILNPDPTPTVNVAHEEPDGFVAHHALLDGNWLIFENFTNLSAVSERFELRAYPMKRSGGGAPVRAIGVPQE